MKLKICTIALLLSSLAWATSPTPGGFGYPTGEGFCKSLLGSLAEGDQTALDSLRMLLSQPDQTLNSVRLTLMDQILQLPAEIPQNQLPTALRSIIDLEGDAVTQHVTQAAALKLVQWGNREPKVMAEGLKGALMVVLPTCTDLEPSLRLLEDTRKAYIEWSAVDENPKHWVHQVVAAYRGAVHALSLMTRDQLVAEFPEYERHLEDYRVTDSTAVYFLGILRGWAQQFHNRIHVHAVAALIQLAQEGQPQALAALRRYVQDPQSHRDGDLRDLAMQALVR